MSNGALTPGLCVSGSVTVRKRRELPTKSGTVKVRPGERVNPETVIAEALREGELRIVKIPEILGITPEDAIEKIIVKPGDDVARGDIIAQMRGLWGLFKTEAQAPISGVIEFISQATGHIGIRAPADKISVRAYISGEVESVDDGRGAVIKADATLVQGIFGVGGERNGVISLLNVEASNKITEADIPETCAGEILIGGHSPTLAALRLAAKRGAVGFVTGSIDDTTLASYVGYDIGIALTGDEPVAMTLIITEGFGELPMNERALGLLKQAHGCAASINGATQVRAGALRPEVITKRSSTLESADLSGAGVVQGALRVGGRVRIIRVPFFGLQGEIVELPKEPKEIATGALARVALVRLAELSGETVVVPRANLEVVG